MLSVYPFFYAKTLRWEGHLDVLGGLMVSGSEQSELHKETLHLTKGPEDRRTFTVLVVEIAIRYRTYHLKLLSIEQSFSP